VAGSLVAGPVTDEFGARWVWGGAAAVYVVVALLGLAMAPRDEPDLAAADPARP
jgi:hypothetical protein